MFDRAEVLMGQALLQLGHCAATLALRPWHPRPPPAANVPRAWQRRRESSTKSSNGRTHSSRRSISPASRRGISPDHDRRHPGNPLGIRGAVGGMVQGSVSDGAYNTGALGRGRNSRHMEQSPWNDRERTIKRRATGKRQYDITPLSGQHFWQRGQQ